MTSSLSVIVIQFTSRSHLVRCLESLVGQPALREVIVPYDDRFGDVATLRSRFRGVNFLRVVGSRTPAELRAAAAAVADAEIIAFLEDHCVPAPDWAERLVDAHADQRAAVGGAVEKGLLPGTTGDTALNWAVYFTDYSRYMNPQAGGPSASLTDCNVSYKRTELTSCRELWQTEFHENLVNGWLEANGRTLWLAPDVVVHEQRTLTIGSALRDRYAFGRLFASTRVRDANLTRRLLFAAGAAVMPPVLIARVARNLFGRGRHRAQFFRALPALTLVTSTWMLGECVGYLTGAPGALKAAQESREGVIAGTESRS